jgi:hypothetical protein
VPANHFNSQQMHDKIQFLAFRRLPVTYEFSAKALHTQPENLPGRISDFWQVRKR